MNSASPRLLATDLDGTFLPLDHGQDYLAALQSIAEAAGSPRGFALVYVTGRHLASVQQAMSEFSLPSPDGMFCDVGTTFYESSHGDWVASPAYQDHMNACAGGVGRSVIEGLFRDMDGLRLQEPSKQERFKISYYCPAEQVASLVERMSARLTERRLPYSIIDSVDPFTDTGLVDVLPQGASKASALDWLIRETGRRHEDVVFAGDSGNDLAVFLSGIPSIVVANAKPAVADDVKRALADGAPGVVYFSQAPATRGVLEGCRHYGLL